MIFYHPRPIPEQPRTGSEMHVAGTLAGFRDLGMEVEIVAGNSGERMERMNNVRRDAERGKRFDFLYGSLTTAPIALNDNHHLPRHPVADLSFFRHLRRCGVPVGLFYPDVYWKFDAYRKLVPILKRLGAVAAYKAELIAFRRVINILFVPSRLMADYVPYWRHDSRVRELFPGCTPRPIGWPVDDGVLRIFYVGAISPPIYDISPLVAAVAACSHVELTVCCPPEETEITKTWPTCDRITIVSGSGPALMPYYEAAHLGALVFANDPYRRFAMPVKLFEYIGMGRPVLGCSTDAAGQFVSSNGLGWAPDPSDLAQTLSRLASRPDEVTQRRNVVLASQTVNSWTERCRQIAETLLSS